MTRTAGRSGRRKTRRGRLVEVRGQDAFPDMPDRVAKKPPKAGADPVPMTLDEAIARTFELMDETIAAYGTGDALVEITRGRHAGKFRNFGPREIAGVYGLYSGGNDSVVLPHLLNSYLDGIIHVNTGTAIRQTTEHVREVVPQWGLPLHELHPKVSYRDLVLGRVLSTRGKNKGRPVWSGFPGPAAIKRDKGGKRVTQDPHGVMYQRLKGQPLEAFRAQQVGRDGVRKKVLYVAGTRWDESDRRFELAGEVTQQGGIIWVAALIHWTNDHMREYRQRFRCAEDHEHAPHRMCTPEALPLNEVTAHIHMSGDCTCGAKAHPGEKEEIRFFFPDHAAWLDGLEEEARAAGIPACVWGVRPPAGAEPEGAEDAAPVVPFLCSGCKLEMAGQQELFSLEREAS